MEQYNSIQQLLKKEGGQNKKPIFPPTVVQAVFDAKTGASLEVILAQFNSIYVQYQGSPEATRNIIPVAMRRAGLTITYMNMDSETITERASSAVQKDNDHWGLDVNWSRIDELSLSGDIAVSAQGTWIINGVDTRIKAVGPKGDNGLTPWLKTIDNKLHYSYDNETWEECSDYLVHYFRFNATSSDSQSGTIGKIQISKDKKTWTDLSPEFRNYLRIQGYVATASALPANQAVGTIYGVGPTYDADDTGNTNPIYRIYVYNGTQWIDNGQFTSIAAGVVQETGNSETEVMSQKVVTEKLSELDLKVIEISQSRNQYNKDKDERGYLSIDGSLTVFEDWVTSGFIYVGNTEEVALSVNLKNNGQRIPNQPFYFLLGYDENKQPIPSTYEMEINSPYSIPGDVKYIRFAYHSNLFDTVQLEAGVYVSEYEEFKQGYILKKSDYIRSANYVHDKKTTEERLNKLEDDISFFDENIKGYEKTTAIEFEFTESLVIDSVGSETQITSGDTSYKTSEFIQVEEGRNYYINCNMNYGFALYALYDINKKFFSAVRATHEVDNTYIIDGIITIPKNVSYIRLSCHSVEPTFSMYNAEPYIKVSEKWGNLRWAVIGDSLTEKNHRTTLNYHDYVSEKTGIKIQNLGISGTGYAVSSPFYKRINQIESPDVITIFGSGNDATSGLPIGVIDEENESSICGFINKTISEVQKLFPTTPFGIITPTPWIGAEPSDSGATWFKAYCEAIVNICKRRGVPCLDLYYCSNLHPSNSDFRRLAYSHDDGNGVHPDEIGHKIIAPRFKSFLDSLIM